MIKQYLKKDGTKAYMLVAYLGTDENGKQRRTTRRGFKTIREAKNAEAKLLADVQENGFSFSTKEKQTFKQVCDLWIENYKLTVKESTLKIQINAIDLHILPKFLDKDIAKIHPTYCQKVVNEWHSYYVKYHNLIGITQRIFDYAIILGLIKENPFKKIVKPRKMKRILDTENKNYYNKEQLKSFLECLKKENNLQEYVLFRLLAFTGARKSEILALTWKDIDFKKSTLSITKTLATGLNNAKIIQPPKTKQSVRTILLDDETVSVLRQFKLNQATYVGLNVKFLICDSNGSHHDADYPNRVLKKVLKKYELPKISVHGFRHTHCSLLFESGATIKTVQERLGHSDIKTTMDIYTHVTEKQKDDTAQNFANYIAF